MKHLQKPIPLWSTLLVLNLYACEAWSDLKTMTETLEREHMAREQAPVMPPSYFFNDPQIRLAAEIINDCPKDDPQAIPNCIMQFNSHTKHLSVEQLSKNSMNDMNLLWFAMAREHFWAVTELVRRGVDPYTSDTNLLGNPISVALYANDLRYFEAMFKGGLDPNGEGPRGEAEFLLIRALKQGNDDNIPERIQLFLKYGADPNLRDSMNRNPVIEGLFALSMDKDFKLEQALIMLLEHGTQFEGAEHAAIDGATVANSLEWYLKNDIGPGPGGQEYKESLERIRDVIIRKGAQWPPVSKEDMAYQRVSMKLEAYDYTAPEEDENKVNTLGERERTRIIPGESEEARKARAIKAQAELRLKLRNEREWKAKHGRVILPPVHPDDQAAVEAVYKTKILDTVPRIPGEEHWEYMHRTHLALVPEILKLRASRDEMVAKIGHAPQEIYDQHKNPPWDGVYLVKG